MSARNTTTPLFPLLSVSLFLALATALVAAEGAAATPPLPAEAVKSLTESPEDLVRPDGSQDAGVIAKVQAAVAAVSGGSYDLSPLVEYVQRHPKRSSCYALMVLRNRAPKAYASLSTGTKAAILADTLDTCSDWFVLQGLDTGGGFLHDGPNYKKEYANLRLGDPAHALLELDPNEILPLLRDGLIDCGWAWVAQDGIVLTKGNFVWWFVRRMQGQRTTFGKFEERWALFRELPRILPESKGTPVPAEIIDAMKKEATEGVKFQDSTQMWHLYDAGYDYSSVAEMISKTPDYRSYHLLMALRCRDLRRYDELPASVRANVLVSALEHAGVPYEWGVPEGDASGNPIAPDVSSPVRTSGRPKTPYKNDLTTPDVVIGGLSPTIALIECGKAALKPIAELRAKLADRAEPKKSIVTAYVAMVEYAIGAEEFAVVSFSYGGNTVAVGWSLP